LVTKHPSGRIWSASGQTNQLIRETCAKHGIQPGQLTLHADRCASMKSKPVALLLADLGVMKTHSRPQVSNDNPFSEVQFETLKYCLQFPERFGSPEERVHLARREDVVKLAQSEPGHAHPLQHFHETHTEHGT
jgi:transposase InsO family protein